MRARFRLLGAFFTFALFHHSNSQAVESCTEGKAFLPDKTNCEIYYACINERPQLMRCDTGLSYDYHLQTCLNKQISHCYTREEKFVPQCSHNEQLIPNPYDCETFYQCDNGIPVLQHCPPGLHFNPNYYVCDTPEHAHCEAISTDSPTGPTEAPSTTEEGSSTQEPASTVTTELPTETSTQEETTSEATDAPTTIETTEGPTRPTTQPPYDPQCPPDGLITLPDPYDCSSFYVCVNGLSALLNCPKDLYYDVDSGVCVPLWQAHCYSGTTTDQPHTSENTDGTTTGTSETDEPTGSPTETDGPTEEPTVTTEGPTDQSTEGTSEQPTEGPTDQPTDEPTEATTGTEETDEPTATPVETTTEDTSEATSTTTDSNEPGTDTTHEPTTQSPFQPDCPATGVAQLPNPNDCKSYFVCIEGNFALLQCPMNLYFDYLTSTCVPIQEANCYGHLTEGPTEGPTDQPTEEPTEGPTSQPTEEPTERPTDNPTEEPTEGPTDQPTEEPTEGPTNQPTEEPTEGPTDQPTEEPTEGPTNQPTEEPTEGPTDQPTEEPTEGPTNQPTEEPTEGPTDQPTEEPTQEPTEEPTEGPTDNPTEEPTEGPTNQPTEEPTEGPTNQPTEEPTEGPTDQPTEEPTEGPTNQPTEEPTDGPTDNPTEEPTQGPTEEPTDAPTETTTEEVISTTNSDDTTTPTEGPTEEPTESPTEGPTDPSTEAPTDPSTDETTIRPTSERPYEPDCPATGVAQIPNPDDCKSFYVCVQGNFALLDCPLNLYFDAVILSCVPEDIVTCYDSLTTTDVSTTPELTTDAPTETTTEEVVSTTNSDDITTLPPPRCPPQGLHTFPNPEDCGSSYVCINGFEALVECPVGEHFNADKEICQDPSLAHCKVESSFLFKKLRKEETCTEGELLPNYEDCGTFYICSGGDLILMSCPDGLYFNENINSCDAPENSPCQYTTTEKGTTEAPTDKPTEPSTLSPTDSSTLPPTDVTTISPPTYEPNCPSNGTVTLPNPEDCTTYFICINGEHALLQCPSNYQYDDNIGQCVPSNGTCSSDITTIAPPYEPDCPPNETIELPNPEDCTSFYVCINGIFALINCPTNYEFDPNALQCVPFNGTCSDYSSTSQAPTVKPTTATTEPTVAPTTSSTDKPTEATTEEPTGTPTEEPTSSTTGSTTPGGDKCSSGEANIFPNPDDCSSYFVCDNGEPVKLPCPPGLEFSPEELNCELPDDAHCSTNTIFTNSKKIYKFNIFNRL